MINENDIKFVASRYRKGRFAVNKAWERLGIVHTSFWSRARIAAAVAGFVIISATAAIVYHQYTTSEAVRVENSAIQPTSPAYVVKVIDFENSPLPQVIERIREVYGVDVENLPENAAEYNLSLHYEGNAVDLVNTINEILDTEMTVKE